MASRSAWVGVVALALAGCEKKDERVPVFPVSGKVLVNGKPTAGVLVVLHHQGGDLPLPGRPNAKTAADGTFRLTSYEPQDGAPAGTYALTAHYFKNSADDDGSFDQFKNRYGDPAKPVRTVTIGPTTNELPVLELK